MILYAQQLTIKDVIREDQLREETKNDTEETKEIEKMINRQNLIFETNKHIFNFQKFQTITSFAKNIFGCKFTLNNTEDHSNSIT